MTHPGTQQHHEPGPHSRNHKVQTCVALLLGVVALASCDTGDNPTPGKATPAVTHSGETAPRPSVITDYFKNLSEVDGRLIACGSVFWGPLAVGTVVTLPLEARGTITLTVTESEKLLIDHRPDDPSTPLRSLAKGKTDAFSLDPDRRISVMYAFDQVLHKDVVGFGYACDAVG